MTGVDVAHALSTMSDADTPSPPVLFFDDDEMAEPGCNCASDASSSRRMPIFLWVFIFGLNALGRRDVLRDGGEQR